MVSALGLKLGYPDVVRMTVRRTGAVFVAFASKLAFSRQWVVSGPATSVIRAPQS